MPSKFEIKKIPQILFILLSGYALVGGIDLSFLHYMTGNGCPVVANVPACYFVTGLFLWLVIAGVTNFRVGKYLTSGILIIGLLFSGYATFGNLSDILMCPVSDSGIPMCYLAFASFLLLSFLYLLSIKK